MGQDVSPLDALKAEDWQRLEGRAAVLALGLLDEPPETVGWPDGERGRLLDVFLLRCQFLAALEERLVGFPPEIHEAATRKAGESGAGAVIAALDTVTALFNGVQLRAGKRGASPRALALGQLLGMPESDPNMRLWSGEDPVVVFGLQRL